MPRTPSEKSIVAAITRRLDKMGAYWIKTHGSAYGRVGTPDLIVCYGGQFFALEVKKPIGGRVTLPQKIELQKVRDAGGEADVVTSADEAEQLLTQGL
jgi:Holliday junction resolvase